MPRRFLGLTASASVDDDPDRWTLFYRLAWRLTHGEPELLDRRDDADVRRLEALAARADARRPPGVDQSAARFVPVAADPTTLELAVDRCSACHRCHQGPAVAGGGPIGGPILIVAESPDEAAVTAGWPLVGDVGSLVGRALSRAGIPVSWIRTTYAIKHKSRPGETRSERRAIAGRCRPWLMAEFAADPPSAIVALGDIAARGVLGRGGRWPDPTEIEDGPGDIPVLVAPALARVRLASAAGRSELMDALVTALIAARIAHDPDFAPPEFERALGDRRS